MVSCGLGSVSEVRFVVPLSSLRSLPTTVFTVISSNGHEMSKRRTSIVLCGVVLESGIAVKADAAVLRADGTCGEKHGRHGIVTMVRLRGFPNRKLLPVALMFLVILAPHKRWCHELRLERLVCGSSRTLG